MSTFYSDGYNDAINGTIASPIDPRKNGKGQETNVYTNEYLEGYKDGLIETIKQGGVNEIHRRRDNMGCLVMRSNRVWFTI